MMLDKYPEVQRLSTEHIDRLRKTKGVTVLKAKDRAPTAEKRELWATQKVRAMFLNLLAAREAHDVMYKAGSMTPAERAWCISRATGEPLTKVLEFKRIYITFWKFALSREKSVEDVKQFCSLFKENERACPREPAENAAELLAVQQEAERAEEEKIAKQKESERIESLKKAKQAEGAKVAKRVEEEKEAAKRAAVLAAVAAAAPKNAVAATVAATVEAAEAASGAAVAAAATAATGLLSALAAAAEQQQNERAAEKKEADRVEKEKETKRADEENETARLEKQKESARIKSPKKAEQTVLLRV